MSDVSAPLFTSGVVSHRLRTHLDVRLYRQEVSKIGRQEVVLDQQADQHHHVRSDVWALFKKQK